MYNIVQLKRFARVNTPMENNHGEYMTGFYAKSVNPFEIIDYIFAVYLYWCETFIVISADQTIFHS